MVKIVSTDNQDLLRAPFPINHLQTISSWVQKGRIRSIKWGKRFGKYAAIQASA